MKALIMDEYEEGASIIDGPEEIIKELNDYLIQYDKYDHPVCWGVEELVRYLNDVILIDNDEKIIILKLWTYDYDKSLPTLKI